MTAPGSSQTDAASGAHRMVRVASIVVVMALIVAVIGVVLASYLVYENVQGEAGVCVIAHGCSTVQNSSYGKILGVPVSVPGALLYVALAIAAVAWLRDLRPGRATITALAFYASLFGAVLSGYLTYLEAFVIDAWCIYCVVSATLVTCLMLMWGGVLASVLRDSRSPRAPR